MYTHFSIIILIYHNLTSYESIEKKQSLQPAIFQNKEICPVHQKSYNNPGKIYFAGSMRVFCSENYTFHQTFNTVTQK